MRAPDVVLIAITFTDDSVGVMSFVTCVYDPSTDQPRWSRLATAENVDREIARSSFAPELRPIKAWHFVDRKDVPDDRTYRNAWKSDGARVVHDMAKAREVHRQRIRRVRAAKLTELDVAYQRADEGGDFGLKQVIARRKQELRDLTADPAIDAATTPEALRATWPFSEPISG